MRNITYNPERYTPEAIEARYGRKVYLKYYDSLTEYHDYLQANWDKHHFRDTNRSILDFLVNDYRKDVKTIESLLEVMREDDIFTSGLPMPESHYYGSVPNVAKFLAGHPKSMMRRYAGEQTSLCTPINIFVNINLSAGLNEQTMVVKGTAIAALAMSLNTTRPVNIYTVKPLYGYTWRHRIAFISMVKINENIIDIGRMNFAMCNMNYHRCISWSSIGQNYLEVIKEDRCESPGAWPFNSDVDTQEYDNCVKSYIGCTPNDIFIPGSAIYNQNLINNPLKWVKDQIAKHKQLTSEEI